MDPFVGQITMFAGNFAPRGWAFCDGQLLDVSQNDALFSLLGTTYGGDGRTTFGLPDLRGRTPIHYGSGPGLTPRNLGARGGTERVTLTAPQLPPHNHPAIGADDAANAVSPAGNTLANTGPPVYVPGGAQPMALDTVSSVGGSQAHDNMMPFQAVYFIIALTGIFPTRN